MVGCSARTITRSMDKSLKEEKEMLNNSLL